MSYIIDLIWNRDFSKYTTLVPSPQSCLPNRVCILINNSHAVLPCLNRRWGRFPDFQIYSFIHSSKTAAGVSAFLFRDKNLTALEGISLLDRRYSSKDYLFWSLKLIFITFCWYSYEKYCTTATVILEKKILKFLKFWGFVALNQLIDCLPSFRF